jgi:hypothetical protein
MVELPPGSRVEVRRGGLPVLLARLPALADAKRPIGAPFTDRLVAKFGLPVAGWRGRTGRAGRDDQSRGSPATAAEAYQQRAQRQPAQRQAAQRQADEEPPGDA